MVEARFRLGWRSAADVARAKVDELLDVTGITTETAPRIVAAAARVAEAEKRRLAEEAAVAAAAAAQAAADAAAAPVAPAPTPEGV